MLKELVGFKVLVLVLKVLVDLKVLKVASGIKVLKVLKVVTVLPVLKDKMDLKEL